jgi:hypothetical protein
MMRLWDAAAVWCFSSSAHARLSLTAAQTESCRSVCSCTVPESTRQHKLLMADVLVLQRLRCFRSSCAESKCASPTKVTFAVMMLAGNEMLPRHLNVPSLTWLGVMAAVSSEAGESVKIQKGRNTAAVPVSISKYGGFQRGKVYFRPGGSKSARRATDGTARARPSRRFRNSGRGMSQRGCRSRRRYSATHAN